MPALQALGHEVIGLPTVLLSNHPGHAHVAGEPMSPDRLHAMLDAIEANGWLAGIDAVLTGYLPSLAHVRFAAVAVTRVRAASPAVTFLCDPVLGDTPKGLYIEPVAAVAIRDELLSMADVVKLNRFELEWLSGVPASELRSICTAARSLGAPVVAVTSGVARDPALILNVVVTGGPTWTCPVARRPQAPNGTGDLFGALLLGFRLDGDDWGRALGRTVAGLDRVLARSQALEELALVACLDALGTMAPLPVETHVPVLDDGSIP